MTTMQLAGVTIRIGEVEILTGVSLEVRAGEFVAIVGPNGAGKTTLLRVLAGLLRPARGAALLDGRPIGELTARERSRRIAFLAPARIAVPMAYPVRDVVALARFAHRSWWRTTGQDEPAVGAAVARFGLGAFAGRRIGGLSDGERQRVWLAALEAQGSDVLLLDEPTSHLDVAHVADTLGALRRWAEEGRAVVAVLHDLDAALAAADRIVVLAGGRLILDHQVDQLDLGMVGSIFGVALAPALVARRHRALVVDYETLQ